MPGSPANPGFHARPARAPRREAAMTTHVSPLLRDIYRILSVECRTPMGELQHAALRLMLTRFKGLSKSARRQAWEELKKELGAFEEGEGDD